MTRRRIGIDRTSAEVDNNLYMLAYPLQITYIWLILLFMNEIHWTPKASKQARKLDKPIRVSILDAVEQLAHMPDCQNVKALTNHTHDYRLRVGNYRVLFDWDGSVRIVEIQEVRKRDERTY